MIKLLKKIFEIKIMKQIIRFGIVGIIAFIIDYALLYILTEFMGIHYLISSTISFIVSLIINYILSIYWVFDVKRKQTIKEVSIFVFLSIIGLGINQIIMYIGADLLSVHYMICKLVATFIVMVYNFITRKLFIEK